jgi:hypothetical protein
MFYQSKIIWLNILLIINVVLTLRPGPLWLPKSGPDYSEFTTK